MSKTPVVLGVPAAPIALCFWLCTALLQGCSSEEENPSYAAGGGTGGRFATTAIGGMHAGAPAAGSGGAARSSGGSQALVGGSGRANAGNSGRAEGGLTSGGSDAGVQGGAAPQAQGGAGALGAASGSGGASNGIQSGMGGRSDGGSSGGLGGTNEAGVSQGGVAGTQAGAAGAAGSAPVGLPVWHWESPTPSGWGVYGLWGTSATNVYAVGVYGNLLRWDGILWREAVVGDQGDYLGVWGSSDSDVFVVGESTEEILHFDGHGWGSMTNPAGLPLNAIWGSSATNVYAVGGRYSSSTRAGVVVHYDGDQWRVLRNDFTVILTAAWGSGPGDLFIGGENGTLLHYDGASYTPITGAANEISAIFGIGATDDVLVFDSAGHWYFYDRSGTALTHGGQLPAGVRSAWGTSLSDIYVAAGTSGIYHYSGSQWAAEALPAGTASYDFMAVWGASDGTLFAGGYGAGGWDSAALLRRASGPWVNDSRLLTPNEFRDVWALSSNLAYAVGDSGTLARWDGQAWSLVDLGTTTTLYGVWAASANDVFVSSRTDTIYHWNGATWAPMVVPGATDLRLLRGGSASDLYVTGGSYNSPKFHHFDGNGWTDVTLPSGLANLNAFWIDPATSTLVVVGNTAVNDTGVFRRAPAETTWTQLSTPLFKAVRAVHGTSLSDLYVATSDDVYHHDGTGWTHACTNPTTGYFTSLWARAANDVWAVGYDSLIMHYDGNAWSVVQNRNSGWELFAMHGTSSSDVIVVGESGTILRYGPLRL